MAAQAPSATAPSLPPAAFTVESVPHALVAARLSAEYAIGVRHGCFCAHPYLTRLLDLSRGELDDYKRAARAGNRGEVPGAVRASAGINTAVADVDRLLDAVAVIASGEPAPVHYTHDPATGDYWPDGDAPGWSGHDRALGASCARG